MLNSTVPEIYLDANATTPVDADAAQAAYNAMEDLFGNPSSSHITGLRARSILESARNEAKAVLGAESGRIVFTSGATEAIQSAVFSALCAVRESREGDAAENESRFLLYGATEHKAVPEALQHWNRVLNIGAEVRSIPVDENGALDLDWLKQMAPAADIVCTMAVNNETGVITDLAAVEAALGTQRSCYWIVDCVQAVGKLPLQLANKTIDYAPVSGHKIYAPKGIGLLYVRENAPLTPLLAGGGQEGGARGGTENLPGVAAIATILKRLSHNVDHAFANSGVLTNYRNRIVEALKIAFPTIAFNTPFETAVPTTINFSVAGFSSKEILDLFDAASIRVSSGSACGSGVVGSFVLDAMGLPKWRSEGAIRLSFGPLVSESEITAAEIRIREAGKALADSCLVIAGEADDTPGRQMDGLIQLKRGSACSWVLLDAESGRCVIIDPFEEMSERIETLVRCQRSQVVAVLDTHKHVDHESCRSLLVDALADQMLPTAKTSDILGWPEESNVEVTLADGSLAPAIRLSADTVLAKTDLPGHTVDSLCFLYGTVTDGILNPENVHFAFSGDTLQIGGIGRTDFYSSSSSDLLNSLRRLPKLVSKDTLLCPTHDYTTDFATTINAEMLRNDFLTRIINADPPITVDDFNQEKASVDQNIDDEKNCELVCGHILPDQQKSRSLDILPADLENFFRDHESATIVDVREPHEFRFAQDWAAFGLDKPPENVPLTRLCDFFSRLIRTDEGLNKELIFLCRSGTRSNKVGNVARRLGFRNVWHIKGGIALGTQRETVEADDMEFVI